MISFGRPQKQPLGSQIPFVVGLSAIRKLPRTGRVNGSGVVYLDCAGLVIEKGIEERTKNVGQNGG